MTYRRFFSAVLFLIFLLTASSAAAGKVTYSYDSNNRLVQADFSGSKISWNYDKNDNMLFRTAADRFSWLLFLPTLIGQGTYSTGIPVQENKKIPAVTQSGMKK
jgi:YD repeat-containing protein